MSQVVHIHDLKTFFVEDKEDYECDGEVYDGTSITLGLNWEDVEDALIDADVVIVKKPTMKLQIKYKLDEDIQSLILNLAEKRKGSGFTVKDITRHIICIYAAYGECHDAVLDSLFYDKSSDVYFTGTSS